MIQETNELDESRYFQYDALSNLTEKIDRRGLITRYTYDRLSRQTSERWFEAQAASPIKGRFVFYNHSAFDNDDADANAYDDDAIAPNKTPLLPGQSSSAANHLGYSKGINGIMVDIEDLPGSPNYEDLDADDFTFRVGTSGDPDSWSTVTATASISVRTGEGVDGSDRVTITWPDNSLLNGWLQVTVKANADTGLSQDDVFYLANMVGDFDGNLSASLTDYNIWRTSGGSITDGGDGDKSGSADLNDYNAWRTAGAGFEFLTAPGGPGVPLRTISYAYDYAGRLTAVTDRDVNDDPASADYTYSYDNLGRLTSVEMALAGLATPVTLAATYDLIGRRTSLAAKIDTTDDFVNDYMWDSLSRLSQVTQSGVVGGHSVAEKRVDFGYNLANQFASLSRYADLAGSDLVATSAYVYDNAGRLSSLLHHQDTTTFADYGWTWDDANRITQFTNTEHSGEDATYTYDNAGQLTGGNYSTQTDESYGYDDNGNRETANGDTYVTGDNNQLTDDDTYTYEYDAEGNLVQRLNMTDGSYTLFEWDHRNRLVAVTDFNEDDEQLLRVEYVYDSFDNLIGRKVFEGTSSTPSESGHFIYDGQQIVLTLDDEGDVENRYLWGPQVDQLLAQEDSAGDVLWALGDHQNTVRDWAEYDTGTTTVVDHAEYDAFGNRLDTPVVDSVFGWTGRYRDQATGLQYNWHRWYDPSIGRWLSEDPARTPPQNLYAYVGNSPINGTDPTGLFDPDRELPWPGGGRGAPPPGHPPISKPKLPEDPSGGGGISLACTIALPISACEPTPIGEIIVGCGLLIGVIASAARPPRPFDICKQRYEVCVEAANDALEVCLRQGGGPHCWEEVNRRVANCAKEFWDCVNNGRFR